MTFGRGFVMVAAIAAAGCGESGAPQAGGGSFAAYDDAGSAMSGAVAVYAVESAEMPDAAACERLHTGYAGEMTGLHERLRDGCGELDRCDGEGDRMRERTRVRDASCVAEAIEAELQAHAGAACRLGTAEGNQDEAGRHVRSMEALLAHQRVRLHEAACIGDGSGTGEGTFTCERTADGGFRFDGAPWAPGSVTPGGTPDPTAQWPHPCGDGVCDGTCSGVVTAG